MTLDLILLFIVAIIAILIFGFIWERVLAVVAVDPVQRAGEPAPDHLHALSEGEPVGSS